MGALRNALQTLQLIFAHQHEGNPRQALQAFIGGAHTEIDPGAVEIKGVSRQPADTVHQQKFAVLFRQGADIVNRVQQAGGGFVVHQSDPLDIRMIF